MKKMPHLCFIDGSSIARIRHDAKKNKVWPWLASVIITKSDAASEYISNYSRQSPPSTLLFRSHSVPSKEVQTAIILRILRYVSPNPWGHVTSEAKRRARSISLISSQVWPTDDREKSALPPAPITAGSQVLWVPVTTSREGKIRRAVPNEVGPTLSGWFAIRQPPYQTHGECGNRFHSCSSDARCIATSSHTNVITVVFDLRFLMRITPHTSPYAPRLSLGKHTLVVSGYGPYHLPCIAVRTAGKPDAILWKLDPRNISPFSNTLLKCAWLEVEFIRSLDAF